MANDAFSQLPALSSRVFAQYDQSITVFMQNSAEVLIISRRHYVFMAEIPFTESPTPYSPQWHFHQLLSSSHVCITNMRHLIVPLRMSFHQVTNTVIITMS